MPLSPQWGPSQLLHRIQGQPHKHEKTRQSAINALCSNASTNSKRRVDKNCRKCVKNIHLLVRKPSQIREIIKLNYACYIHRNNLSLSFMKVNVLKWIIHTRIWLAIQLNFFPISIFLPVSYWIKSLINYLFIFSYVIIHPFIYSYFFDFLYNLELGECVGIVRNFTEDNSRNGSIKLFVVGARPIYSNRWKTPPENCDTFVHARLGS